MLQVVETDRRLGQLARKWNQSTGLPQLKTPDRQNAETIAQAPFGKYWLINPTASRREKAWPPEKFRELATHLLPILKEKGLKLKIIGAAHETEWLKEAVPLSETSGMVIQTKAIGDLQDVLAGAQVLITNTSSMQFLAPGQKVRTMTLMGRSDPAIWGPLGPRDTVIRAQNLESTSRDLFEKEAAAYRSIEVERVLKECKRFLNEAEK